MRILNPSASVSFSFICILSLFLLLHCHTKNNKNKQIALAAVVFTANNSSSSCDAGIVASNILVQYQTRNIITEKIDCDDISNFKFDSRVFSPILNSGSNQLSFENTISIPQAGNSILFPMPTILFNTSRSILFDPVGYKINPKLYDYIEYRAMLFNRNGTYTGMEAVSEESAEAAFREAFQKCQKGFSSQ